jgi:transposase
MESAMTQADDLSRSLTAFDQDSTLVAVIEMSLKSWLVAGIVPGVSRAPLKKLAADADGVLRLLHRWRDEAIAAGRPITRVVVAFEAGRDGFWLARWLRARGIEAYVIHAASVAVSREHRRAKTDRLDAEMLKRGFLGWLRGEPKHCQMAAIPTLAEEDARRPNRERDCLVRERTRIVNRMKGTLVRLGVSGFNPKRRKAAERLDDLVTPQGRGAAAEHAGRIAARSGAAGAAPQTDRTPWSAGSRRWPESASRPRTCWFMRSCRATCGNRKALQPPQP